MQNRLENLDDVNYESFESTFEEVLDKHAPMKKKSIRSNDAPFVNKTLRKAIMKRSKLRNEYNKSKCTENWNRYREQRNLCVAL